MFVFKDFSILDIQSGSQESIFVFGTEYDEIKKGNSTLKGIKNSLGIPVVHNKKRLFSDRQEEFDILKEKLSTIWNLHIKGKTIVLPKKYIGTGLARLNEVSPVVFKLMERFYTSAKNVSGTSDYDEINSINDVLNSKMLTTAKKLFKPTKIIIRNR